MRSTADQNAIDVARGWAARLLKPGIRLRGEEKQAAVELLDVAGHLETRLPILAPTPAPAPPPEPPAGPMVYGFPGWDGFDDLVARIGEQVVGRPLMRARYRGADQCYQLTERGVLEGVKLDDGAWLCRFYEAYELPGVWHRPMLRFRISGYGFTPDHMAWDIAPPLGEPQYGAPVYPLKDGVVEYAGPDSRPILRTNPEFDRGLHVWVDHGNGEKSLYCHADQIFVATGLRVYGYIPLGGMGASGAAAGPHWHIAFERHTQRIDWLTESGYHP